MTVYFPSSWGIAEVRRAGFTQTTKLYRGWNGRQFWFQLCINDMVEQINTMQEQTKDPTRYRFPGLWSPNRENHIQRLENELAEAQRELRTAELVLYLIGGIVLLAWLATIISWL